MHSKRRHATTKQIRQSSIHWEFVLNDAFAFTLFSFTPTLYSFWALFPADIGTDFSLNESILY